MAADGRSAGGSDPAISLFALRSQLHASMHSLWAVYVAASFAAAGYGSSTSLAWQAALAVTIGFWLFAFGHLALLRQTLRMIEAVRRDLMAIKPANTLLSEALKVSARIRNPLSIGTRIQLAIDVCVTAAIWFRIVT